MYCLSFACFNVSNFRLFCFCYINWHRYTFFSFIQSSWLRRLNSVLVEYKSNLKLNFLSIFKSKLHIQTRFSVFWMLIAIFCALFYVRVSINHTNQLNRKSSSLFFIGFLDRPNFRLFWNKMAGLNQLNRTIRKSLVGSLICGAGALVGGLVGGPIGIGVGSVIGGAISARILSK